MNTKVLSLFLRKELRDVRGNPQVLPGYLLLPAVAVALPAIMLAALPVDPVAAAASDPDVATLLRFASRDPMVAHFPERERIARIIVRDVGAFFLLMPVILSSLSAALSIAIEKQQRTLEPILATPVSDRALLLAKLIGAVVPAIGATWVAAALSVALTTVITGWRYGTAFTPDFAFLIVIVLLAPLGGAAAALAGIRVSLGARDVQSAVQTTTLWVLPASIVIVVLFGRAALLGPLLASAACLAASLLVWWLYRSALARFDREEILTRWN